MTTRKRHSQHTPELKSMEQRIDKREEELTELVDKLNNETTLAIGSMRAHQTLGSKAYERLLALRDRISVALSEYTNENNEIVPRAHKNASRTENCVSPSREY